MHSLDKALAHASSGGSAVVRGHVSPREARKRAKLTPAQMEPPMDMNPDRFWKRVQGMWWGSDPTAILRRAIPMEAEFCGHCRLRERWFGR